MKKLLFLAIFAICAAQSSFAQEARVFNSKLEYVGSTEYINQISSTFFNNEVIYQYSVFNNGIYTIGFEEFTDKVVFITLETDNVPKKVIEKSIKSFSLKNYFNSSDFTRALQRRIKDKNFTDLNALNIFGKPYAITESTGLKIYHYNYPNISLRFERGILVDHILSK